MGKNRHVAVEEYIGGSHPVGRPDPENTIILIFSNAVSYAWARSENRNENKKTYQDKNFLKGFFPQDL